MVTSIMIMANVLYVPLPQSLELQSKVYDPMTSWQGEYARMKVRCLPGALSVSKMSCGIPVQQCAASCRRARQATSLQPDFD